MSGFTLPSWDEMEAGSIMQKAALNLVNLDTSEAERELDEKQEVIEKAKALKEAGLEPLIGNPLTTPMNPEQLNDANTKLHQRVLEAVRQMDGALLGGERITVSEKRLLNCRSDLNQLIPFRYSWAWSLYLTASEQHWMPGEFALFDAAKAFESSSNISKKMLVRLYLNYKYRERVISEQSLLNCYRLITNPECRQYILRQGFESALLKHFVADLENVFNVRELAQFNLQYTTDVDILKQRNRLVIGLTPAINDLSFDTNTGVDATSAFIEQLIYLYGYGNWVMNIIPLYQMLAALKIEGQDGLGLFKVLTMIIRDIQTQTVFIKMLLIDAFGENFEVLTPELKQRVISNFNLMLTQEQDFASTQCNTNTEYKEAVNIARWAASEFLNSIGIDTPVKMYDAGSSWFVEIVSKMQPHIDLEAGLSGQGGNLEW